MYISKRKRFFIFQKSKSKIGVISVVHKWVLILRESHWDICTRAAKLDSCVVSIQPTVNNAISTHLLWKRAYGNLLVHHDKSHHEKKIIANLKGLCHQFRIG
jgi:hypothetical protein